VEEGHVAIACGLLLINSPLFIVAADKREPCPLRDQEGPWPAAPSANSSLGGSSSYAGLVTLLSYFGHEGEGSRTWLTAPYPVLLSEVEYGRLLFREGSWDTRQLPCVRERLLSV
jgi:hypothetical protein